MRQAVRPISSARRRMFLAFTLIFPVVFFAIAEITLRLVHYGPNLDLFVMENIGGRQFYVMNPDVKARYFSRVEFNPSTSIDYFEVKKLPGTYRIFCLGGSTTVGFPYGYGGAFPAFLRTRLHRLFPERTIEVINLGMTATNSYTVNDIAAELANYSPDAILVYDGHNEFYGALGAASYETMGNSRWLIQTYLHAIHLRSFLLLRDLFAKARGWFPSSESEPEGTMMERLARGKDIPLGSALYRQALESFRTNLHDVCTEAGRLGIPVILGTQVSNLQGYQSLRFRRSAGLAPLRFNWIR